MMGAGDLSVIGLLASESSPGRSTAELEAEHLGKGRTSNIELPTPNIQWRKRVAGPHWMFDVGCWMLDVLSSAPFPPKMVRKNSLQCGALSLFLRAPN